MEKWDQVLNKQISSPFARSCDTKRDIFTRAWPLDEEAISEKGSNSNRAYNFYFLDNKL